jgi:ubiquinone/menaquinone biosynthesis C-methylase UbiE
VSNQETLQREYYARTAGEYGAMHSGEGSAHDLALKTLAGILPTLDVTTLLDVGCGTGRALSFFQDRMPQLALQGIEPVAELAREAELRGVRAGTIHVGDGKQLPFADESFDVVTSFGVLHHVRRPELVLNEMLRVARRAVFISDSNRFGQGRPAARYLKLALHAARLWSTFDFIRTRGRGYMLSEGDGLYYSYSVFDSMALLRARSKRIMTVELECAPPVRGIWSSSISNATTLLVGAIK